MLNSINTSQKIGILITSAVLLALVVLHNPINGYRNKAHLGYASDLVKDDSFTMPDIFEEQIKARA